MYSAGKSILNDSRLCLPHMLCHAMGITVLLEKPISL